VATATFAERANPEAEPTTLPEGNHNDRLMLRKRSLIETIIDQLKNISPIEHSWHPSPVNSLVNLVGGLIAYCHQPKKPSIAL